MKNLSLKLLVFTVLILSLTLLASCSNNEGNDSSQGTITLNVYNWGEYISDGSLGSFSTNEEFEKYYYEKFGQKIKVNYTTYATNEDMYSKISSGAGGTYDIIIPSDYMIDKMASEGLLLEFDPSELENYKYVSEDFKGLYYDPENKYTVPYTYGVVGIIYNSTMVDEEDVADKSWGLLWNEKYSGKILQFNNPRDGLASAMYYQGIDINSTNKADWDKALNMLIKQKPLIQAYVSDEIFNKLISNSASIAPYYAGDYITMSDSNPDLSFYYPKEGTNVFVDAMCIPYNSKHPDIAKEYINFMLSEEVAVANAIYTGYASPNTLVKDNPDYIDEMGEEAIEVLYGSGDINANYPYDPYYHKYPTQELQDYTNGLWEELKTQNSTELWVHVTTIVILIGLILFASYNIYIKKYRSKDYRERDKRLRLERQNSKYSNNQKKDE
jgi:spermidine/putrescine transport system substrate-binding protein